MRVRVILYDRDAPFENWDPTELGPYDDVGAIMPHGDCVAWVSLRRLPDRVDLTIKPGFYARQAYSWLDILPDTEEEHADD